VDARLPYWNQATVDIYEAQIAALESQLAALTIQLHNVLRSIELAGSIEDLRTWSAVKDALTAELERRE